jgi:hypothetical protein
MLSCCTAELDPSLRVVTAEEVFEVDVPQPNVAAMQTRAARPDRPAVDLRRLVAGFLRMAPDIAIVGEVRDREASLPLVCSRCEDVWQHPPGPPAPAPAAPLPWWSPTSVCSKPTPTPLASPS